MSLPLNTGSLNITQLKLTSTVPENSVVYLVDETATTAENKNLKAYVEDFVAGAAYAPGARPAGTVGGAIDNATALAANAVTRPELAAPTGAGGVGSDTDGGTVQEVADNAKPLSDYSALRGYSGRGKTVQVTGVMGLAKPAGIFGDFRLSTDDTTTPDNGGTVIVDAAGRRWKRPYIGPLNAAWFGVKADGSDDLPAAQAAMDYASSIAQSTYPQGCVTLQLPDGVVSFLSGALVHKSGVMLSGQAYSRAGGTTIVGYGAQIITTPAGRQTSIGLSGLRLLGGSSSVSNAVWWQNVGNSTIENVTTNNTQDQGILVSSGVANHYRDILVVNALLNRVRAADAGAFELADNDPTVDSCEITGSPSSATVADVNLRNIAILARCTSGFFSNTLGQYGDVAWKVTGSTNRITNCRADASLGHAAIFNGSDNAVTAFGVLNCGTDQSVGADMWDAIQVNSTSNRVQGLTVQKTGALRGRYVVNIAAFSEVRQRSAVSGVTVNAGAPAYLSKYNVSIGGNGVPSVALDPSGYITQTTGATLDLQNAANIRLLYAAAETITTVVNAVPGQIYTLILNGNATLAASGGCFTFKDASTTYVGRGATVALQNAIQFIANTSTVLKEIGR